VQLLVESEDYMHQPHVVILESRRFPDITEQWYNVAVGALTQQGITFSRVTVPHAFSIASFRKYWP
jgi:6,7-dimethyl-8-ribityllumazine synthase